MSDHIIRWLHFSDFHVGKDDYAQICMFSRIIKHIGEKKQQGWSPDFLFITGDIANEAKPNEYDMFNFDFLDPLQKMLGAEIKERTFTVPGNHDVDRSVRQAFDRQEIANPNNRYFDADDNGLQSREILLPRFKAYEENDLSAPTGKWINSPAGVFQVIQDVNEVKVGIIGINTAWLSKEQNEREKLTPGTALLEHAFALLEDCQLRFVIGHHPLDWFLPIEGRKIKSLMGKASAIYLHGHLHEAWAEPSYGGGYNFLTIQSGAAFQARDDEKWRNGIVFGEADIDNNLLRLQPWVWNDTHKCWALGADAYPEVNRKQDWWEYALPGTAQVHSAKPAPKSEIAPPPGWSVATFDQLHSHTIPLDLDTAIPFFDGAAPGWRASLSSSTPRRSIVATLINFFANSEDAEPPQVVLLLGGSCEGKTTALLQAAFGVVENKRSWKILRRTDETVAVDPSELMPLLDSGGDWLVVIDEADRAIRGVVELLQKSHKSAQSKLHFLLACRESDWSSSGADKELRSSLISSESVRLFGLEGNEAADIVRAWTQFGSKGLGDLFDTPEDERVAKLLDAARREAKVTKGAFFGALLTVRFGEDLKKHAKQMLERLEQRQIANGVTLSKALTFIAAMHAEELEFLSRPVLANALNCSLQDLRSKVLRPLSAEAASTTTSNFIFTRHLRIARAIIQVMVEYFDEDIGLLYVQLAEAAIDAVNANIYTPENPSKWRHTLPEHFFDTRRQSLGITIAEALFKRESTDYRRLVELAKFYRKAGAAEQAVRLFRTFQYDVARGFFSEWATSEGNAGDYACNALLSAYSLADQCQGDPLSREQAKLSLSGLTVAFGELYETYLNQVFADGRAAAAVAAIAILGSSLKGDRMADKFRSYSSKNHASGAKVPTPENATTQLHNAILAVSDYVRSDYVKDRIGIAQELTFKQLDNLISISTRRS